MLRRMSCVVVLVASVVGLVPAQTPVSPHAYFDALVARPDHWKSESLRDAARLFALRGGNQFPLTVSYAPATDTDPHAQDAAKAVIPAFTVGATGSERRVVTPMDATVLEVQLDSNSNSFSHGQKMLIESEVVIVSRLPGERFSDNDHRVRLSQRGAHGTTATAHPAGVLVGSSTNSLSISSQIRVPLGTEDGRRYLFTWDAYYTDSYVRKPTDTAGWLKNHKAFQFTARSSGGTIWQEPATRFTPTTPVSPAWDWTQHVAEADWRAYQDLGGAETWNPDTPNAMGPEVTNPYPLRPRVNHFIIHPNRWHRWWVAIDQRPNAYDTLTVWMADEVTGPTLLYDGLRINVWRSGTTPSIVQWWVELNTSDNELFRLDQRDLVMYVRNFVALRDHPQDWTALRVRPLCAMDGAGTPPVLAPPHSLRIFRGFL
jgi:hypothetical protein